MRQHLRRARRGAERKPPLALPAGGETIWRAFHDLRGTAQRDSFAGMRQPITYAEMLAWSRLMRIPLHPDEIRAIRDVDAEWRAVEASRAAKPATEDEED